MTANRCMLAPASALLLALALAGCEHHLDRSDQLSTVSGAAIKHNAAIHTADPWSKESADTNIPVSAERLRHAIERYYEGPPKPSQSGPPAPLILMPTNTTSPAPAK